MNVITLSNDQLALVKSTLQKLKDTLNTDMNVGEGWSGVMIDLVNDHYDLVTSTLREFEDCNIPKVVAPLKISTAPNPTPQETPVWENAVDAAKILGVNAKKLYNLKSGGHLAAGHHFRRTGKNYVWHVANLKKLLAENSH